MSISRGNSFRFRGLEIPESYEIEKFRSTVLKSKGKTICSFKDFEKLFKKCNTNGTGYLTRGEFKVLLGFLEMKPEGETGESKVPKLRHIEIDRLYETLNVNNKGIKCYPLFQVIRGTFPSHRGKLVDFTFDRLDLERRGFIDASDVKKFVRNNIFIEVLRGEKKASDTAKEIFKTLDLSGSGKVYKTDFDDYYLSQSFFIDSDKKFQDLVCDFWRFSATDIANFEKWLRDTTVPVSPLPQLSRRGQGADIEQEEAKSISPSRCRSSSPPACPSDGFGGDHLLDDKGVTNKDGSTVPGIGIERGQSKRGHTLVGGGGEGGGSAAAAVAVPLISRGRSFSGSGGLMRMAEGQQEESIQPVAAAAASGGKISTADSVNDLGSMVAALLEQQADVVTGRVVLEAAAPGAAGDVASSASASNAATPGLQLEGKITRPHTPTQSPYPSISRRGSFRRGVLARNRSSLSSRKNDEEKERLTASHDDDETLSSVGSSSVGGGHTTGGHILAASIAAMQSSSSSRSNTPVPSELSASRSNTPVPSEISSAGGAGDGSAEQQRTAARRRNGDEDGKGGRGGNGRKTSADEVNFSYSIGKVRASQDDLIALQEDAGAMFSGVSTTMSTDATAAVAAAALQIDTTIDSPTPSSSSSAHGSPQPVLARLSSSRRILLSPRTPRIDEEVELIAGNAIANGRSRSNENEELTAATDESYMYGLQVYDSASTLLQRKSSSSKKIRASSETNLTSPSAGAHGTPRVPLSSRSSSSSSRRSLRSPYKINEEGGDERTISVDNQGGDDDESVAGDATTGDAVSAAALLSKVTLSKSAFSNLESLISALPADCNVAIVTMKTENEKLKEELAVLAAENRRLKETKGL